MTPPEFLAALRAERGYRQQLVHVEQIPPREARYGRLARPLHPTLAGALKTLGIDHLFTHQSEAISHALAGEDLIVATGTASGKTLCFNAPVLDAVARDRGARALYLYPTKALAQDQLRTLGEFQSAWSSRPRFGFGAYDGDTPAAQRTALRQSAQIVLTNPDMLSIGILPNHRLWQMFFRGLRYVVVDEAHAYRGVFGSQVACVLRRLLRICSHYDNRPQFVLCSATIANPVEHARNLTGRAMRVVDDDGSPRSARWFAIWNPPVADSRLNIRRGTTGEAAGLFAALARTGLRSIVFANSRRSAERILAEAREQLKLTAPGLAGKIRAYRAGYLPEARREIERGLFDGDLLGVTATNALELGIDVGDLDATVLAGYPGTAASLWQQAGRAGRGTGDALTVLIAGDDPLNQYFARNPAALFARPVEHALTDPDNPYILEKHLPAAAQEVPLSSADEGLFGPGFVDAMVRLENTGTLEYHNERWQYHGSRYPAQEINLRSASHKMVKLVLENDPKRVVEEIDAQSALHRAHTGAIYLHQADAYLVTRLDTQAGIAIVRPVAAAYYTEPRTVSQTYIVRSHASRPIASTRAYFGTVRVSEHLIGYRRRQQFRETTLVDVDLDYPPQTYETRAIWWDIPAAAATALQAASRNLHGSLHAVEHLCTSLLPLFAMCDRHDIAGVTALTHPDTGKPQVFLYDTVPGGIGISESGFALLEKLWQAALDTVTRCACRDGCPACIQSPDCGSGNDPLDKAGARLLLTHLLRARPGGETKAA
ncbi:MAG: DEAD/DEAH box helicase [Chloroflexi bacterium]|nr:DEAD/DEAH box helicase [Chloroflexota bacterium]